MSQPNQPVNEKPKTVRIRMKPGCGRMLIGRSWRLSDGTISRTVPKDPTERLQPEDEFLEARQLDSDGNPLDGPIVEIPVDQLAGLLKDGKPFREIDGYKMAKTSGGIETDSTGRPVETHVSYSPKAEPGKFDDVTFEIVR